MSETRLTAEMVQAFLRPFAPGEVETRKQGRYVPYIDARVVMHRLDEVVPGEWAFDYDVIPNERGMLIKGRLTVCGITRCDGGEEYQADDKQFKSAISDSLKRCAVLFGIGRYLYELPSLQGERDAHTAAQVEAAARKVGYKGPLSPTNGNGNAPARTEPTREYQGKPQRDRAPEPPARAQEAVKVAETQTVAGDAAGGNDEAKILRTNIRRRANELFGEDVEKFRQFKAKTLSNHLATLKLDQLTLKDLTDLDGALKRGLLERDGAVA